MENKTKISLLIAATGLGINQYEKSKLKKQPYLNSDESNLKMLGGVAIVGGLASALIFEKFKDNAQAKKISFIGLGGIAVLGVASIVYAMKKMT
jgi:FtsH-binding integral membrane protein